jgi:hypothetical protein
VKDKSMNATEDDVKNYVQEFHKAFYELSTKYFSQDYANRLPYNAFSNSQIMCYVSTKFGVAIEYIKQRNGRGRELKSKHSSARVEDMLIEAPASFRDTQPAFHITRGHYSFSNLHIKGFPFRISNDAASVILENMYVSYESEGWQRYIEYAEIWGDRNSTRWSVDSARSLAKELVFAEIATLQFAYEDLGLLNSVVKDSQTNRVLILGSYSKEDEDRLREISKGVEKKGYKPVLIKDIPDFEASDIRAKVRTWASLCSFLIMDDSEASGHLVEFEMCRSNEWALLLMRAKGSSGTFMTRGASSNNSAIHEIEYDLENIQPAID